jgi:ribosomal protein S18 acetylase RimI-like enzyme
MAVIFYRREFVPAPRAGPLPPGARVLCWCPARDGFPRGFFATPINVVWWLADKIGLFARRDFTVIAIERSGKLLHRLMVTPKWYRFPDMGPGDLQLGMLWTAPEARGQGLAGLAIATAHELFGSAYDAMWYLVDEDNTASRRLIERFDYPAIGRGVRTRPFGIKAFGRSAITERS